MVPHISLLLAHFSSRHAVIVTTHHCMLPHVEQLVLHINLTNNSNSVAGMLLISEWWASETAVMMGGLLPDAQRQLSAMAIYQTTNAMCFMLPLGIAVAVSTRSVLL